MMLGVLASGVLCDVSGVSGVSYALFELLVWPHEVEPWFH